MGAPPAGALCYGDCLDWMGRWDDATVDLIYLDPPFNSNADYNVLYAPGAAGGAQTRAFADTWSWDAAAGERLEHYRAAVARPARKAIVGLAGMLGESGMLAYLTYMAERLEHCHRLLKPTGSLYLHCDPTASHYLRAVLDAIFGAANFRSEIIWRRINPTGRASKRLANNADHLLCYASGEAFTWNPQFRPHDPAYIKRFYRQTDDQGPYTLGDLKGAGLRSGPSGKPWRGIDPAGTGSHWAIPNRALPDEARSATTQEKLDLLDEMGRIYWPAKGGMPRYKRYLHEMPGTPIDTIWDDIGSIQAHAKERMGYPTQKPVALLERIISASSNPGDIVLDPFCGCGTTVEAARNLGRQWCGIDISAFAVDLVKDVRLKDPTIPTLGIPADLAGARKLAHDQPFAFESWAVTRLPGFAPNTKQIGDGGIDGRATLAVAPDDLESRLALAQVKGGKFHLSQFRDFRHVLDREDAALGCYVTVDPSPAKSRADAKTAGRVHVAGQPYDRLQLWSMADYFEDRWPVLPVMTDPYSGRPINQPGLF